MTPNRDGSSRPPRKPRRHSPTAGTPPGCPRSLATCPPGPRADARRATGLLTQGSPGDARGPSSAPRPLDHPRRDHGEATVPSLYIDGRVGRLRRRHLQPGRQPVRRDRRDRGGRRDRRPGPGRDRRRAPRVRHDRLAAPARPASAPPCSTASPRSSTATSRRWPGSRRSTPARRCARAAGTWPTSRASSAITPTSPTRTPGASSTRATPTRSAGSSTSRSGCAG